jgi:hypothetical protein
MNIWAGKIGKIAKPNPMKPRGKALLIPGRSRFHDSAAQSAIAALPREGRIARQCRRCLIANDQIARMRQLREWCYPGAARQHWHQTNIYRALKRLGARRIAWGVYALHTEVRRALRQLGGETEGLGRQDAGKGNKTNGRLTLIPRPTNSGKHRGN